MRRVVFQVAQAIALVTGFAFGMASAPVLAEEARPIVIAAGSVKGLYYPLAVRICELINVEIYYRRHRCVAVSTAGSVENLEMLRASKADFAFVQSDLLAQEQATDGSSTISMVAAFHSEPVHLIVRSDSEIAGPDDLRKRRVSFGSDSSGSLKIAELIDQRVRVDFMDLIRATEIPVSQQSLGLCTGKTDAIFWVSGIANVSAAEAFRMCDVRLLSFPEDWLDEIIASTKGIERLVIPGGTYHGASNDVTSFGPRALLVTHGGVHDEIVDYMLDVITGNIAALRDFHRSLRGIELGSVTRPLMDTVLTHPLAQKYLTVMP